MQGTSVGPFRKNAIQRPKNRQQLTKIMWSLILGRSEKSLTLCAMRHIIPQVEATSLWSQPS